MSPPFPRSKTSKYPIKPGFFASNFGFVSRFLGYTQKNETKAFATGHAVQTAF
jgi:hypothetical protein